MGKLSKTRSRREHADLVKSRVPKKKERKQTTQGRDGRTVRRHHTGILGEKCGVSRRPPSGVYHFLSLSAVSHQFSQRPSCHLAFFPLSSFSLLLSLPLIHRSPRPRSETPLSSADLLLSLLLSPFCVTPLSPLRVFWSLEFIEHSSRKDHISDSHCEHIPPCEAVAQVHSRLKPEEGQMRST